MGAGNIRRPAAVVPFPEIIPEMANYPQTGETAATRRPRGSLPPRATHGARRRTRNTTGAWAKAGFFSWVSSGLVLMGNVPAPDRHEKSAKVEGKKSWQAEARRRRRRRRVGVGRRGGESYEVIPVTIRNRNQREWVSHSGGPEARALLRLPNALAQSDSRGHGEHLLFVRSGPHSRKRGARFYCIARRATTPFSLTWITLANHFSRSK